MGYGPEDHHQLALTQEPKRLPATELDESQRELLTALLGTYVGRVPDGLFHGFISKPCTSRGQGRRIRASRTTTGSRVPD